MGTIRSVPAGRRDPSQLMFAAATLVLPGGKAPHMGDVQWQTRQDDLDVFQVAFWEVDEVPVLLQRYRCEDKDRYTLRLAAQQVRNRAPTALVRDVLDQWGIAPDQVEWWNTGLDLSVQPLAPAVPPAPDAAGLDLVLH